MPHATLSPSSSKRWIACPGSIAMQRQFKDTSNRAADEGTAMHEVAQLCLSAIVAQGINMGAWSDPYVQVGELITVSDPHEPLRTVFFTEAMADVVQGYIEACWPLIQCATVVWVEHSLDFSHLVGAKDQFGTGDLVLLLPGGILVVIDLKTGFVRVDPDTPQLKIYGLAALSGLELAHDIDHVRMCIYQPEHYGRELREHGMDAKELKDWGHEVLAPAAELALDALQEHGKTPADSWSRIYLHPDPNEDDCLFCRAIPECPAYRAKLEREVGAMFDDLDDTHKPPEPTTMDNEALARAMKVAPMLEDWITATRAETERRLMDNVRVPGFGLELGRQGPRAWKPGDAETAAAALILAHGYDETVIMEPRKLKSPTQLEKLAEVVKPTKKNPVPDPPVLALEHWRDLQQYITRSDAKPSVKPLSVIRVPWTPPSGDASDFDVIDDKRPPDTVF